MSLWRGLSEDGQTIVLRKLTGDFKFPDYVNPDWLSANQAQIESGVIVDVETTGLSSDTDKIIEIALTHFKFLQPQGELVAIAESYSAFQDPGFSLSPEITALTEITDSDVRGQAIDWQKVQTILASAHIVIAHNAAFDRSFIQKHIDPSLELPWGCSLKNIDWPAKGYATQKLEILSAYHGFFTDAHRAGNDVTALLSLLHMSDLISGRSYLSELVLNAKRKRSRVRALGSPFEAKDLLKSRGYRWDSTARLWNKVLYKEEVPTEVSWLENQVYLGPFKGDVLEVTGSE